MTDTTLATAARPTGGWQPATFVLTVFVSAGLVFMVEPMVARLVLPTLGGSPAVWNTCLAFFQAALLLGYLYADLLQRVRQVRTQVIVHLALLVVAAIALPLQITRSMDLMGDVTRAIPALWLLGVLALTIGGPFAVLSATAPLVQAWHAKVFERQDDAEPYALYAASNLGSLIALVAYPILIEPNLTLHDQRMGWSAGYAVFVLIMASVAFIVWRRGQLVQAAPVANETEPAARITWADRGVWIFLAAVPSSLMLGVTTFITMDVGSAPFLWVAPLALYLLTFVIAFQQRPVIGRDTTLIFQAAFIAGAVVILPFSAGQFILELFLQLTAFFLTALMCHQALVARRPPPERLTEFYFYMSLGGVVGGAFNAFLAPIIFTTVIEYPAVLVLSCLARPWGDGSPRRWEWITLILSTLMAVAAVWMISLNDPRLWPEWFYNANWQWTQSPDFPRVFESLLKIPLAVATVLAFLLRRRAFVFLCALLVLAFASSTVGGRQDVTGAWRSFFGVLRESRMDIPGLDGPRRNQDDRHYVRALANGTTLHGAQASHPDFRCQPLVYYAHETPIGQVFDSLQRERPGVNIGAVGLGTGSVAAYVRPTDRLTFFEIDPLVVHVAHDWRRFTYTTECARGPVNFVLGDARLTLERQAPAQYDILLIDAFSSDAVPAHLLTVEAIRMYLSHLRPDGILILHLSNRNLNLRGPAMSSARAAGGYPLMQLYQYSFDKDGNAIIRPPMYESPEHAVIVARNPRALDRFRSNSAWCSRERSEGRPWTDDYTNLFGALLAAQADQAAHRYDTCVEEPPPPPRRASPATPPAGANTAPAATNSAMPASPR